MMNETAKRSDFKDKISPHLEVLLQFSLSLTKNGRDAARLMREAITEASRSWDESMPEESCKMWLHEILTRRFFIGFQQHARPRVAISGANGDVSLVKNDRLSPATTTNARQNSFLADESEEDVDYFEAIASLPAVFRSAMILSYLEGFSNREIGDLAGVQPHVIESLLNRGRGLLQEDLFAHLMGNTVSTPLPTKRHQHETESCGKLC